MALTLSDSSSIMGFDLMASWGGICSGVLSGVDAMDGVLQASDCKMVEMDISEGLGEAG